MTGNILSQKLARTRSSLFKLQKSLTKFYQHTWETFLGEKTLALLNDTSANHLGSLVSSRELCRWRFAFSLRENSPLSVSKLFSCYLWDREAESVCERERICACRWPRFRETERERESRMARQQKGKLFFLCFSEEQFQETFLNFSFEWRRRRRG